MVVEASRYYLIDNLMKDANLGRFKSSTVSIPSVNISLRPLTGLVYKF